MSNTIAASSAGSVPIWRAVDVIHLGFDGKSINASSAVAEEVPVAFRFNGFAHAVMMATPNDLADFTYGFSLSEGIIAQTGDVANLRWRESDGGIAIDVTLAPAALHRYLAGRRVRALRGHTSCGLCGAEDLRDVRMPAVRVTAGAPVDAAHVKAALDAMRGHQPLSRQTRGAHAAAWVGSDGGIRAVREDVGRHNALDKLIGAGLVGVFGARDGFCLITSRCSFEMVQKAARAGYGTLVSAAAPTALAMRTAASAGLALLCLDRAANQLLVSQSCVSRKEICDDCTTQI